MTQASRSAAPFELVLDENGTETRQSFRKEDRAMAAWEAATRRNTCFSAHLLKWRAPLYGEYDTLADHQSE